MMLGKKSNIYTFASLFLVLIIDMMGAGLIFPILAPIFVNQETATSMLSAGTSDIVRNFYFGLTMAIFFIFSFFGAPLMGDLSDQFGRKKILLLCLVGTSIGFFISALGILFKSILLLIAGRAVGGFAAGSLPIAQASIIDISTEANKTTNLGLITLACSLGFIIGPLAGGYFSSQIVHGWVGYSLPFFIAGVLALLNASALVFTFTETFVVTEKKQQLSMIKALSTLKSAFVMKELRVLSVIFLLMQTGWSIYFQFVSLFLAKIYHYTPSTIGLFMAYLGFVFSISLTLIIRIFVKLMKLEVLILFSLALMVIGTLLAVFFKSESIQWLCALPIAVGVALSYACFLTLFSNRVDRNSQGLVMGVTGSLMSVAWGLGGLFIGPLTASGTEFPFAIAGLLAFISLLGMVFDYRQSHKSPILS